MRDRFEDPSIDVSGIGGTLAGNALSVAAMRAALRPRLREEDFAVAVPLAERFTDGVAAVIAGHGLPWHVQRLGCRAEYWFSPPPRTAPRRPPPATPSSRRTCTSTRSTGACC